MKIAITTLYLLVAASSFAQTGSEGSVSYWQRHYNEGAKLFMKKDVNTLGSMMTPDFKMTSMGRTENAKQSQAGLRQFLGMMSSLDWSFRVSSVKLNGPMATVMNTVHFKGTMKPMKDKKKHVLAGSQNETAVWVKKNGKWMLKSLVASNERMTMDGKPFSPPVANAR